MKAIVIPYDNKPYTVDYPYHDGIINYDELKYLISHLPHPFSWFEIVTIEVDGYICHMYLDEQGKMKYDWQSHINDLASELYGNLFDCIVGDVVLLLDKHDSDSYLFTDGQANDILDCLVG